MLLPFRPGTAWPAPADWEEHKQTIAHLYLVKENSLKEVMNIMEHEHGFKATTKMYKNRFRDWGFRKNLTKDQSKQLEAHILAGKPADLPIVHGHRLGSKRLKNIAMRAALQPRRTGHAKIRHATLLVLPQYIQAPGTYRQAEASLTALVEFSNHHFDEGNWIDEANKSSNQFESFDWMRPARQAAWGILNRVNISSQFQVLNKACDGYGKVLRKQDPFIIWATYQLVLDLLFIGEDVAKSFIKLAAGISSIYLGTSHPVAILCSSIMRMDELDIRQLAIPLMEVQSELFRERAEQGFTFFPTFMARTLKSLVGNVGGDKGIIGLEQAHQKVDEVIQWIQQHEESYINPTQRTKQLVDTYLCKTCLYSNVGDVVKAQEVLGQAEQWLKNVPPSERTYRPLVDVTEIKAILFQQLGDYESAERWFREALDIAIKRLTGSDATRIGYSFEALRGYFEERGDLEAAEAVRLDFDKYLESIVAEEPCSEEKDK